jgi:hypothetical protein
MPSQKNQKGVKMSLGDFMGGAPANDMDALPTGPKARGCVLGCCINYVGIE